MITCRREEEINSVASRSIRDYVVINVAGDIDFMGAKCLCSSSAFD